MDKIHPMRGLQSWRNPQGVLVLRVHYSANPEKAKPEWKAENKPKAPSEEWWNQEQEIDFGARQGSRVYHQFRDDETQVVDPFPIPGHWTRCFILDTHPRKPHAMLWVAMSPQNEAYAYRELWPSKSYGTVKNVPEDDNNYPIRWYCDCIKWLESDENPENKFGAEKIYERVIDYAARSFGKDRDDPDAIDYQERYETYSREIGHPLFFEDCKKGNEANYAEVNEWLRPKPSMNHAGEIVERSRLRIFSNLVELRWQLLNNRVQMLQPHQIDKKDPEFKVLDKKNDVSDCIKYWAAAQPKYYERKKFKSTFRPIYEGINA